MGTSFYKRVHTQIRKVGSIHKILRWGKHVVWRNTKDFAWDVLRFLTARCRRFGPVKGIYSDFELLRGDSKAEGRIILLNQGVPVVKPDSPMVLCGRSQHAPQNFPIFWIRRKRTRLIGPGLVHINDQKQLSVEAAYGNAVYKEDPAYQFFLKGEPLQLKGPWMSLVSRWVPVNSRRVYGHWLLDALPRLAVLNELPAETRIIIPTNKARFMEESLELLGVLDRCRWTSETNIEVEDYYFASPHSMIVCYSPHSVDAMRSMYLPLRALKSTPKRFFVRRTGTFRNMVNEKEVLDFFQSAGWVIVDLVDLRFAEQIAWFAGAEAVAGIHGSGLNNVLWTSRGCKVVELFADQYLAGDAEWTAQCTGAEYYSLIFPSDLHLNAHVDLDRVRSVLKSAGLWEPAQNVK